MERIVLDVDSNDSDVISKVKKNARYLDKKMDWTIKFSSPLDKSTINSKNMYVKDSSNNKIDVSFSYDTATNSLSIKPVGEYKANENYFLVLTKKVKSREGGYLRDELVIHFAQKTTSEYKEKENIKEDTLASSNEAAPKPTEQTSEATATTKSNESDVITDTPKPKKSPFTNDNNELTMQEKYGDKLKLFQKSLEEYEERFKH